jgi:hypothetical protein
MKNRFPLLALTLLTAALASCNKDTAAVSTFVHSVRTRTSPPGGARVGIHADRPQPEPE